MIIFQDRLGINVGKTPKQADFLQTNSNPGIYAGNPFGTHDGISGYFGSIVSAGPNSTHNGTFLFSTWDKGYGKRASAKVRENPTHTKLKLSSSCPID
jgi:hypothetical protein